MGFPLHAITPHHSPMQGIIWKLSWAAVGLCGFPAAPAWGNSPFTDDVLVRNPDR